MNDILRSLEAFVASKELDFHVYFRHRSLALKELHRAGRYRREVATAIPCELLADKRFEALVTESIDRIRDKMLSILMSPFSAKLLCWLYCCPFPGSHSALTKLVPSLQRIAHIVRSGPNVYKLSGWVVHVLIGYSVVTDYIPKGRAPATCLWSAALTRFFSGTLRQAYLSLDPASRMILHAAMLGHDIGVVVNITDHDAHGVPLVSSYVREIGITQDSLRAHGITSSLKDTLWAIESVVRYHTLVNRIGVEFSRKRSESELDQLISSADERNWRTGFIRGALPSILLLVGTADLIAVDDSVLDATKLAEIERGHSILVSILAGHRETQDVAAQGFARFLSFTGKQSRPPSREELDPLLSHFGYDPEEFWAKCYHIQELNFALSLLRYLPEARCTLLVLLLAFHFIDLNVGGTHDVYEATRIVFDHNLEPESLLHVVTELEEAGSLEPCASTVAPGKWEIGGVEIQYRTEERGYTVEVAARKEGRQT